MKTKIVFWGNNDKDERILVGLSLRAADNMIDIYTFPEEKVTDAFYEQMMEEWRMGKEVEFPEGWSHLERPLNASDSLLPDEIKASRSDLISRAQTEWQFVVLSEKLHQSYQDELDELKKRIEKLESFDKNSWDTLKEFWNKVQGQARERNLFWEHANKLRDTVNELFGNLKEMRSKLDNEFREKSKENMERVATTLEELETKIKDGSRLRSVFNELKKMQKEFWDLELTREHRQKLRKRINQAFKTVKEKRFGTTSTPEGDQNALVRITRRYEGLLGAIEKMDRSIARDRKDLEFQEKRIANTEGQLEAQIRKAKLKMIEERLESKESKLAEMNRTKAQLEDRINKVKEREELKKVSEEARNAVKEKIADEIRQRQEDADEEKLAAAAEQIKEKTGKEEKKKTADNKESIMEALGATLGDALEDVVDTVKAIADLVGEKIEGKVEDLKKRMKEEEE